MIVMLTSQQQDHTGNTENKVSRKSRSRIHPATMLLRGVLVGVMGVGCSQSGSFAPSIAPEGEMSTQEIATQDSARGELAQVKAQSSDKTATGTAVAPAAPQLIKTAELEISVEDTTLSIEAAQQIVRQQQGDLLQLQDTVPVNSASPHRAYLQLRVPQHRLEQTLEQLIVLGKVKSQSITAEDVSSQLVDYEARLRNLKKAEESVLKIMERSGEIGDVLKVAQELQTIRENIERINAQLQHLKTSVAFSTINLQLVEPVSLLPGPDRTWGQELQTPWQASTRALGNSARTIAVVMIWGVTFSPYLLVLGSSILIYRRLHRRFHRPQP